MHAGTCRNNEFTQTHMDQKQHDTQLYTWRAWPKEKLNGTAPDELPHYTGGMGQRGGCAPILAFLYRLGRQSQSSTCCKLCRYLPNAEVNTGSYCAILNCALTVVGYHANYLYQQLLLGLDHYDVE